MSMDTDDVGQTVEDADHRIDPDELFRVAMARQQTSFRPARRCL